jgi:hypothetical protein
MNMATAVVAQAAPSAINLVRLMKPPAVRVSFRGVKSIRVIVQRETAFRETTQILEPSLSPGFSSQAIKFLHLLPIAIGHAF